MIYHNKEYFKQDFEQWIGYSDGDICDILSDYRHKLYEAIDYIKGDKEKDLFDMSEDVSIYRQDIFVGLLARSMFDLALEIDEEKIFDFINILEFEFKDLLTAPASTAFHGDWKGGLLDHSYAVLEAALKSKNAYWDDGTAPKKLYPLFFILHDICKFNCYCIEKKNVKDPNTGKWETKDAYKTRKDYRSSFHGSESVYRIYELLLKYRSGELEWLENSFTENWRLAISYHMGMFDISDSGITNYRNAFQTYPEVLLMHHADMIASQLFKM